MKKGRLLLLVICLAGHFVQSKNYYLASNGNDANNGTSISTPWKTIEKLNASIASLLPGDSILFKRGDSFNGSLNLTKSGSVSAPLVFSSYGSGNGKSEITGATEVNNWVAVGGNIWRAYHNNNSKQAITGVYINGKSQEIGRFPNRAVLNDRNGMNGWKRIGGNIGDSVIIDNTLPAIPNFTGATLIAKENLWSLYKQESIVHVGTQLQLQAQHDAITPGWGYILTQHIKTLDLQGEWYFDKAKDSLYLFSNVNPNGFNVEATNQNYIVQAGAISNIRFVNLTFSCSQDTISTAYSQKGGMRFSGSVNITFENCEFSNHGHRALYAVNCNRFTVRKCSFSNNNGVNIRVTLGGNYTIEGNIFRNTSLWSTMATDLNAVTASTCNNVLIQNNLIDSCGYVGIYPYSTENSKINRNIIKNYLMVCGDGGAIYTHYKHTKLEISENMISNGQNGNEGSNWGIKSKTRGIYFDRQPEGISCFKNTIYSPGEAGIFLQNNTKQVSIRNNTVFDQNDNAKGLSKVYANNNDVSNDTIAQNIFFCINDNYPLTCLKPSNLIGHFDSNYYCKPYTLEPVLYRSTPLNLAAWVDSSGKDIHTKASPILLNKAVNPPSQYILFLVNESQDTKNQNLGTSKYLDAKGAEYSGSVNISPYSSLVLIKKSMVTGDIHELASTKENVQLYPNPNHGQFKVILPEVASSKLELYNSLGQMVYQGNHVGDTDLKLVNLPKGVYTLKVQSREFNQGQKIIIE